MKEQENNLEIIDVSYELGPEEADIKQELLVVDSAKEETEKGIENEQEINEEIKQEVQQEEKVERDTSFKTYNEEKIREEKKKRKSWMSRICSLIKRLVILVITIPITIMLGMAIVGITGGGFITGIGSILVGIGVIAAAGFIMSAYSPLIGILGLFIALGLLSGGGLVICLMIVVTKWLKSLFRGVRRYRKQEVEEI